METLILLLQSLKIKEAINTGEMGVQQDSCSSLAGVGIAMSNLGPGIPWTRKATSENLLLRSCSADGLWLPLFCDKQSQGTILVPK